MSHATSIQFDKVELAIKEHVEHLWRSDGLRLQSLFKQP